jgi:DNA-binding NtrC family response regulator
LRAMLRYTWPGNVRELANRVRRAVVMTEGSYIDAADLGLTEPKLAVPLTLEQARDEAERNCVIEALIAHGNRPRDAAQALGISRVTLYRLLERHDLKDFAAAAPKGLAKGLPESPRV